MNPPTTRPQAPHAGGFMAGTLVHTKEGLKPIEQIKVGDWVLSRPENPEDGTETAYKRVVNTFRFEDKPVASFAWKIRPEDDPTGEKYEDRTAEREWVLATPNHPVWVQGHGWMAIDSLHEPSKKHKGTEIDPEEWEGPVLRMADGRAGHIGEANDLFQTDQPHVVYEDWGDRLYEEGTTWDFSQFPPEQISNWERFHEEDWPVDKFNDAIPFTATVYNIEVEDWHTYFVGETGLWVHNTDCADANLTVQTKLDTVDALIKDTIQMGRQGTQFNKLTKAENKLLQLPKALTADTTRLWFEPGACFAKGTLVHTKEGLKPIEQIQVGDWVLSKPENGGEQAYKRVLKTFEYPPERVVGLKYEIPVNKPDPYGANLGVLNVTLNHPFWVKELGWTGVRELMNHGKAKVRFEDVDGVDIVFWEITRIYVSDQPNVGWLPMHMGATDCFGALWNYDTHTLVNAEVLALEAIQETYRELGDREAIDPDLFFKAPVYNLEVEDFHTYYVGKYGIWVHNQNCGGLNFEVRNTIHPVKLINPEVA